jgi:hypothetical protein
MLFYHNGDKNVLIAMPKDSILRKTRLNKFVGEKIDLLLPVFLIGIILVSSGCVTTIHFADAKKKSSTGDTGGGGTKEGGTPNGETPPSGGTETPPSGGTETPPSGGTETPPSGGTETPPSGGTETPPPQQQPSVKVKAGQINEQTCVGVVAAFECNLNVNNIHKTTIREGGSTVVVGQPATTASGATPVILYIQGVGYVQVTGIQAAGSGQATISYVVLVPAK